MLEKVRDNRRVENVYVLSTELTITLRLSLVAVSSAAMAAYVEMFEPWIANSWKFLRGVSGEDAELEAIVWQGANPDSVRAVLH